MREQCQRLEHHAKVTLVSRGVGDVFLIQQDAAAAGLFQSSDKTQQGGLAASGWTQKADKLAVGEVQIHIPHRYNRPEILSYVFKR